jgi:hypothetical protein
MKSEQNVNYQIVCERERGREREQGGGEGICIYARKFLSLHADFICSRFVHIFTCERIDAYFCIELSF